MSELEPLEAGGLVKDVFASTPVPLLVPLAALLIGFCWTRASVAAIFGTNRAPTLPWPGYDPTSEPPDEDLILVGPPGSGKTAALRKRLSDSLWIDMATEPTIQRCGVSGARLVVLDHFERSLTSTKACVEALRLVETLVFRKRVERVVVVSNIDPVFHAMDELLRCDESDGAGREARAELAEKLSVLKKFSRRRFSPTDGRDPSAEWRVSTRREKAALAQIAENGWPNYRNRAIEHLLQRHVLDESNGMRFRDERLANYIRERDRLGEPTEITTRGSRTTWQVTQLVLVIVLLAVVSAALYFSRNQFLGMVVSGATVLAPIIRLAASARKIAGVSVPGVGQVV